MDAPKQQVLSDADLADYEDTFPGADYVFRSHEALRTQLAEANEKLEAVTAERDEAIRTARYRDEFSERALQEKQLAETSEYAHLKEKLDLAVERDELKKQLAVAAEKVALCERDWYTAKSDFGDGIRRMREQLVVEEKARMFLRDTLYETIDDLKKRLADNFDAHVRGVCIYKRKLNARDAQVEQFRAVLTTIEWVLDAEWGGEFCNACDRRKENGHSAGCIVNKVLAIPVAK